jgi:hypothetical protein
VLDRTKTAFQKWIDPKLNRRYQPVPGHTRLVVTNAGGDILGKLVIKKAPDEVKELHATDMQVVAVPRQLSSRPSSPPSSRLRT